MASYRKVDAARLVPKPGPHPAASAYDKGVGEELGLQRLGVYRVELPPGAETVAHDHAADDVEDVYAAISGAGAVVVDGEEVPFSPGEFVAVRPGAKRQVRAGSEGLVFVAVCA